MNKKHLHICHSLSFGGITTFVKALANLNTNSNANHHILVWQKEAKGENVIDISNDNDQPKKFRQLVDGYDLLFVHSLKLSFLPTLLKHKSRVFLFQHGMTFGSGIRRIYKQCVYFFVINVLGFKVVCSSNFAKQKLKAQIGVLRDTSVKIIPFGIDGEHQSEITPSQETLHLGFAGRLVAQKRIHLLLESLSQIKCKSLVVLKVAGTGQLLNTLKKTVQQINNKNVEVNFLGELNSMSDFYANIDVFVLPSIGESYGLVVLEALFHNVPVIVFEDTGACVDFVVHGENGYVVKNEAELSETLCELQSVELRQKLKRNIQQMDYSKYHISSTKSILDEL
ncbi:glycosyltransferase family 4 protein [Psychroserpens sp. XS_ASV72]|uniref:glycosyltransferase family 4 protein n=1 Tax=Psychroserpens sp. XS_ASV72 TaxID=3241293 RepID=UPI003517A01A